MLPKVLDIKVEWNLGWENGPDLQVLISRIPKPNELKYERNADGLYIATLGDYSSYYFHSDPPERPDEGFGGRVYELEMKTGEIVRLVGPWSSRAGCVNMDFAPVVDVHLTDDPKTMERGYTFMGGAITLEAVNWWMLKKVRKMTFDWMMVKIVKNGEAVWEPRRTDGKYCPTCKGFGKIPKMVVHRVGENDLVECKRCGGDGFYVKRTEAVI
jgi:hypothetical protein